jgi:hypothetical protein
MALFTDTAIVTIDDLLPFEASLVQVASSHGINVDIKIGLATSAIGDKLMLWLLNAGASDPQWLSRRTVGLSTVVVTPILQRWICFESLSRIYAEAYNAQLNTRYQGKWSEYQKEAANASEMFCMSGLGIVYNPLPRPDVPLVSVQAGNVPAQAAFIQTAWVDGNGNESALSLENGTVLPDNSSMAVAMAEGALGAPAAAIGWNVYAGAQSGLLTRQNATPVAIGEAWDMPPSGLQVGSNPSGGQNPAFYITLSKRLRRG